MYLPPEILDIIYKYKHKFETINIFEEIRNPKTKCINCDKNKICLYKCIKCKSDICYECRYEDLEKEIVDQNTFTLFYECDKCDLENYNFEEVFFTEDESENEDYELFEERYHNYF